MNKIEKIRKVLIGKPELLVKLIESLKGIEENVGEPFKMAELIEALKTSSEKDTTKDEFLTHYAM